MDLVERDKSAMGGREGGREGGRPPKLAARDRLSSTVEGRL
jgi:hypothetical protein